MKMRNLLTMFLVAATLVGCGTGANTSSGSSSGGSSNLTTVRMIQAEVLDTAEPAMARHVKKLNSEDSDLSSSDSDISEPETEISVPEISSEPESSENSSDSSSSVPEIVKPIVEVPQYVIIYKDITDITLTITLDNPEAFGIDALRVTCDDPEAQIQVEGEWKPISQEANGTRVVNWSSEDPYEKTYNIRTTSLEDLYTFKVVDIRLAGHDTFLSKQTNSTDFGNNELDIYKMDTDAYELDVVSNTFEEIKFGIKVKEGVTNLSNFKVDGKEPDENGYWVMNESKEDCEISYDFELKNGVKVSRSSQRWIGPMEIASHMLYGFRKDHFNNDLYVIGLGIINYLDKTDIDVKFKYKNNEYQCSSIEETGITPMLIFVTDFLIDIDLLSYNDWFDLNIRGREDLDYEDMGSENYYYTYSIREYKKYLSNKISEDNISYIINNLEYIPVLCNREDCWCVERLIKKA